MKKSSFTLILALVLCVLISCGSSGQQAAESATDTLSDQADPSISAMEGNGSTKEAKPDHTAPVHPSSGGNNSPAGETVALIFDDYSDFLQFAETGKVDPTKCSMSPSVVSMLALSKNVFIDVKQFFDIPITSDRSERVVVEYGQTFDYSVCSLDANGKKQLDFSIIVSYSSETNPGASVAAVQTWEELKNAPSGAHRLQLNNSTMTFGKGDTGFYSCSWFVGTRKIHIRFSGGPLTVAEIEQLCGPKIAALFSCDVKEATPIINAMEAELLK